MKSNKTILLSIFLLVGNLLFAQLATENNHIDTTKQQINKRLLLVSGTEIGAYAAGLSFLSFIWYKDSQRVPFHYYKDGKGYLQIDKCGHAFSAYKESAGAYSALRWAGVSKKKALIFGGGIGLLFQTPIEVFDGMYEHWGFSWGDMIANASGSALFTLEQALFDRQIALMKFSYAPSKYPKYYPPLGESAIESFFLDYNGHTYWMSLNLYSITKFEKMPKWLNFAIGYGGEGMLKEFDNPKTYRGNPLPHFERYRQYLFSLDVDFSTIKTKSVLLTKVFKVVNVLKVPFPTLELNRVDRLKFHALYY